MKQNTTMEGHLGKASPNETGESTNGMKSKTESNAENVKELCGEKKDVKDEIDELGENKEDTRYERESNKEGMEENVQGEMGEQGENKGEMDRKSKNVDENKEIQVKNKKDSPVEKNNQDEKESKGGETIKQGENMKHAEVEIDNQRKVDKEIEGEIEQQVDNSETLNGEINKQVEGRKIQGEMNQHGENIEDCQGETNKQSENKDGNQSEICGEICLQGENNGTENEPMKHGENTENVKGDETNDSANSKIDIANFFKKYDEIILNSPVLSDTGEDDETGQGHDCDKGQGQKKGNMLRKLRQDKTYRRKLLHTVFLCWSFVVLGWIIGQFGPSFLDLQVITHTRLEEGSAFMTSHSVGYLFGSLISGILFDKFNKLVLLFLTIAGNGITVVVIPWCVLYEMMIAIHTVKGLFSGGLDALGNAYLVYVWGDENGSYMQALHFAFAIGGIISPLATAPFLVPRHHDDIPPTVAMTTPSTHWNSTVPYQNNTVLWTPSLGLNNMTNSSTISNEEPEFFKIESRVYIAYLISAILAFSAAFPFLYMHLKSENKNGVNSKQEEKSEPDDRKLPLRMKVLIMSNMMCMMGIYSAIEDTYAGFLTTFVVQQLHWTKTLGSFATSFYWAAFGTGRFFGIFLVKFCYPVRMISIYCMLLVLAFVGLLFSSTAYFDEGLWVCVPLAGLALSIIFPTVFTWTEEELLPVTGKVASLFLIASSSGTMINPIVLGFLMDELTPMYFCYLLLGESIILFFLYVSALCLSRNIQKGKMVSEVHLDMELPVKSNSEPELYKGEDEGLLGR